MAYVDLSSQMERVEPNILEMWESTTKEVSGVQRTSGVKGGVQQAPHNDYTVW